VVAKGMDKTQRTIREKEAVEVEVTVKVPKPIVDFLTDFKVNIKEYLETSLIDSFRADFECFIDDPSIFLDIKEIAERYRLGEIPGIGKAIEKLVNPRKPVEKEV